MTTPESGRVPVTDARRKGGEVRATLSRPEVHEQWERGYRTPEVDDFHDLMFDELLRQVDAPKGSLWLDAGCGNGAFTARLVRAGYVVHGIDFSADRLAHARARGLASATFAKADLTNLEDPDGKWQYILCWGVLMHIPDVEAAVAELARVLAPAGVLVVGEGNSGSWQARAQALYNRLRRPEVLKATPAGMEYWTQTSAGPLLSRSANVAWLVRQFHRHRLELKQLRAGGFAYKPGLPAFLSSALLVFNRFYFEHVRWAAPAASNFLVLHKR